MIFEDQLHDYGFLVTAVTEEQYQEFVAFFKEVDGDNLEVMGINVLGSYQVFDKRMVTVRCSKPEMHQLFWNWFAERGFGTQITGGTHADGSLVVH